MRIVKGPCLIDIGLDPLPSIKPQRHKVNRERLRLFMRKRNKNQIIKWEKHFFL